MKSQPSETVRSVSSAAKSRIVDIIALGPGILGFAGACYYVYDLIDPNRFVGDMYGMEVMFRLALLSLPMALLIVGIVIVVLTRGRQVTWLIILGCALVLAGSTTVLVLSLWVGQSRQLDGVRHDYPRKTVAQLARIARETKDVPAIDAMIVKRDPAAVPVLAEILLDTAEDIRLRIAAANALGQLGGEEAKEALERARSTASHEFLVNSIDHALETIARTRRGTDPSVKKP
jgi:hypothetical protein